MANRPVFVMYSKPPYYKTINVEFKWSGGFAKSQSQKNIKAIHSGFSTMYPEYKILEISSKSFQELGTKLSAFSLTKYIPELKVLLAGNGPLERQLQEQIQDLQLDNYVKLLGYRTDLEKVTPAVDLVVSCSFREGLPLNIIEAMLCKKTVVVSENRGHKELVRDGINGCIVKADNLQGYIKAIMKLYNNPQILLQMENHAYNIARQYTAKLVKEELKRIYHLNKAE